MSFKRSIHPAQFHSGKELDADLFAIGINLSYEGKSIDPNIEDAIVAASIEAVNQRNGRIAGLLVDWISIHFERINADRLTRLVSSLDSSVYDYVRIFWVANAQRLKDPRFSRLGSLYKGKRVDYLDRFKAKDEFKETSLQLQRKGEDQRFKDTCLRVPEGIFQHRLHQIFSASEIAKRHMAFRYRIMFGPSYRADMWAALRRDSKLSPTQLAERTYGSYATAHKVKEDYLLVKRGYSNRHQAARL